MSRTRLAPSPTGALHLGNARTFLINWAVARQRGWAVTLRIEDLDGPRVKPGAANQAIETLRWLGLKWDEGPHLQSSDRAPYQKALDRLARQGAIYPCRCSRSQIQAASLSAPHGDQHELRYGGACRPASGVTFPQAFAEEGVAWRLRVPEGPHHFCDDRLGAQAVDVQAMVGDFLVATKRGLPCYQLAVVVDDHRQGVDQVVRGDDLLSSTPRQRLIYEQLGWTAPSYWHLPIVTGQDGRRLAKRHGDTRLDAYRESGVSAERVIGLLAEWCGLGPREEMSVSDFANRFNLDQLPEEVVVFTPRDDAWLRNEK